jgi:phosphocarrier protein HPr
MIDPAYNGCAVGGEHRWRTPGRCICDRCGFVNRLDPFDVDRHALDDGVFCRLCGFIWICSVFGHRWNRCVCSACGEGRFAAPFRREQHDWILDRCYLCDARCGHQKNELKECRLCGYDGPRVSVEIRNRLGLHGQTALRTVQLANRFESQIAARFVGVTGVDPAQAHDVKSMRDLLAAQAGCGARISLEAIGNDAEEALHALVGLIRCGFGEGNV